ncbi:MAG: M24 family metallopeptidase [Chloroflexota bacterium]
MSDSVRRARLARFQKALRDRGIDAAIVWLPAHQHYLSGFLAHIYSRPIFTFITPSTSALVVPGLEEDHARSKAIVDRVIVYREMPGATRASGGAQASAMSMLEELLAGLPGKAVVGVEGNVLPWAWAQVVVERGLQLSDVAPIIYRMREVKDEEEQRLLRIAGKLASIAVRDTLTAFRPGITEPLAELEGNRSVLKAAAEEMGDVTVDLLKILTASGVEKSAMPHAVTTNRTLTSSDLGIHRRHVWVEGYESECERTFFIGDPSAELKRMFAVMCEAQQAAAETLRGGVPAAEVDRAARDLITRAGYGPNFVHRTGHSIGMEPHELPDMRHDSDRILESGMVVTVEPGIYVPGVGGVRHSDTYIITDSGSECITFGAKDLASCTVWQQ